jgi:hypothetical protein
LSFASSTIFVIVLLLGFTGIAWISPTSGRSRLRPRFPSRLAWQINATGAATAAQNGPFQSQMRIVLRAAPLDCLTLFHLGFSLQQVVSQGLRAAAA